MRHDPAEAVLLAPVPDPQKVICLGLNYRDHAIESNMPIPEEPVLFSKFPSALAGHGDEILLPPESDEVDYEAELVVVIGRRGKRIAQSAAAQSTRKTITPSQVEIQAASTTSAVPPRVSSTTWNAEASSRTGFFMSERLAVAYATNYLADSAARRESRRGLRYRR